MTSVTISTVYKCVSNDSDGEGGCISHLFLHALERPRVITRNRQLGRLHQDAQAKAAAVVKNSFFHIDSDASGKSDGEHSVPPSIEGLSHVNAGDVHSDCRCNASVTFAFFLVRHCSPLRDQISDWLAR